MANSRAFIATFWGVVLLAAGAGMTAASADHGEEQGEESEVVCCGSWLGDRNTLVVLGSKGRAEVINRSGTKVLQIAPAQGEARALVCDTASCWMEEGLGSRLQAVIVEVDRTSGSRKASNRVRVTTNELLSSPERRRLYLAEASGKLVVLDESDLHEVAALTVSHVELFALARDSASGAIFVGDEVGNLFSVEDAGEPRVTGRMSRAEESGLQAIFTLVALGDARALVGRASGAIQLADFRKGTLEAIAHLADGAVVDCAAGATPDTAVCGTTSGRVIAVNLSDRTLRDLSKHPGRVIFVETVEGDRGVSLSADGMIREWRINPVDR